MFPCASPILPNETSWNNIYSDVQKTAKDAYETRKGLLELLLHFANQNNRINQTIGLPLTPTPAINLNYFNGTILWRISPENKKPIEEKIAILINNSADLIHGNELIFNQIHGLLKEMAVKNAAIKFVADLPLMPAHSAAQTQQPALQP